MKSTTLVSRIAKVNGSAPLVQKANLSAPALVDVGLIVLDLSLQLIAADEGAIEILSALSQDSSKRTFSGLSIPKEILDVLKTHSPTEVSGSKVRFRTGKQAYICRIFLLEPPSGRTDQPRLALYLQRELSLTDAIDMAADQYHLSDREKQALEGIAIGLTGKEMAARMNITPNTVKSFVRIIMIKMGVGTRAAIVSKLLEYSNQGDGL